MGGSWSCVATVAVLLGAGTVRAEDAPVSLENSRAIALAAEGKVEEAVAIWESLIPRAEAEALPALHKNLGRGLHRLGRHAEALAHYDRALELRPGDAKVEQWREEARKLAGNGDVTRPPDPVQLNAGGATTGSAETDKGFWGSWQGIGLSTGLVLLAGGAVGFYVAASNQRALDDDFNSDYPSGILHSMSEAEAARKAYEDRRESEVVPWAWTAYGLWAAGGAAALTSVAFRLLAEGPAENAIPAVPAPVVTPGSASMVWTLMF